MSPVVVTASVSYARAVAYPGAAGFQVRTVEWVRDHGGSGLVDAVENWWYTGHWPLPERPLLGPLPVAPAPPSIAPGPRPAPLPVRGGALVRGEARWVPGARTGPVPVLHTGFFRLDPTRPPVIVGVAWLNQMLLRVRLVAGTRQPVDAAQPAGSPLPPDIQRALVATFNSGFRMGDANGGYYADGREVRPLVDGAASLVIDRTGVASVGAWGRDARLGPQVATVRQNLRLVVDGGRPEAGLDTNPANAWGAPGSQQQLTWRSGVGTDAGGNLVYVAAARLTLAELAGAMVAAGVVRGMELDIHTGAMVTFNSYRTDLNPDPAVTATKLLPTMLGPPERYLVADQRDFFAVSTR